MPETGRVKAFIGVMIPAVPQLELGISLFRFPSRTMKFDGILKRLVHCSAVLSVVHWQPQTPNEVLSARLGASLSVMSRAGEKFPDGARLLSVSPQADASRILGGRGFSEGPLGTATPEEARREINYRGPQGE